MPIGKPGELIVKGPQVMRATKGWPGNSQRPEGWLDVYGDIATMDEDGYFISLTARRYDHLRRIQRLSRDIDEVYYGNPKWKNVAPSAFRCKARENVKLFVVSGKARRLRRGND